jgi:hypothetical protein
LSQHTKPAHQAFFGGAVSFLCHGFCKPSHGSTFIFFKRQRKKIKELQPTHKQKLTPKKTA